MTAFAVKHFEKDHGPLSKIMREVKKTPHSYTSKDLESSVAAKGNYIYVIAVRAEKGVRSYWLGYKYRAFETFQLTGKALWKEEFKYKNSARPTGKAEGQFFDIPVRLTDTDVCEWLTSKKLGMAEIPYDLVCSMDDVLNDPDNGAQTFS